MSDLTGGQAVVELLKAEHVRYIFGIVGATFLDVLDALYDDKAIEYINCRHEQGSAFMADGLARVTGTPGVCLVTSGPGDPWSGVADERWGRCAGTIITSGWSPALVMMSVAIDVKTAYWPSPDSQGRSLSALPATPSGPVLTTSTVLAAMSAT